MGQHRFRARAAVLTAALAVAGTLVGAAAPAASADGCTDPHQASGIVGKWGPVSKSNCAVFGHNGYKQGYSWRVQEGTNQYACVEGWGFDSKHTKGKWFSLGCGTSNKGTVPWGNVAANPQVRAKSMGGSIAVIIDWFQ
ncbi:hypothetical protein FPZ12_020040 [Amycolatopsis acidicola]|uniref:Secreted protein n=1 Tax=Amycolatopsis acidicola TaxID=2596893 RepID=A0A5N0V5M2_9PSEU|nr:hypothetical protein [Amycolatopsis acidicola]KAA9159658.1 hypothetical protein FPZ12_020040 [Amycolatopsis acidicola]